MTAVVDLTGDWEGRDPLNDYEIIKNEIALYKEELADRPRMVVANKIDACWDDELIKKLEQRVKEDSIAAAGGDEWADSPFDPRLYKISALTGEGVDSLKAAIATRVHALREEAKQQESAQESPYEQVWEYKREKADARFRVVKLGKGVFRVIGNKVERIIVQTDWNNEEAITYLQHRLKRMGVDKALIRAGAVDGDEIRIVGRSFEFEGSSNVAEDVYDELYDYEPEPFVEVFGDDELPFDEESYTRVYDIYDDEDDSED